MESAFGHTNGNNTGTASTRVGESLLAPLMQGRPVDVAADLDLQEAVEAHRNRLARLGFGELADETLARRNPVDGALALWIPAGAFERGCRRGPVDERPASAVQVSGFYMDIHPITAAQMQEFARQTGQVLTVGMPQDPTQPAVGLSWEDAQAYCRWSGKRLPSEAEWEKAARGNDGRAYPWGETFEEGRAALLGQGYAGAAPVGSFPAGASPYGMQDMAGNVWEWVADWYAPDAYARLRGPDPQGVESGEQRVVRGGSWVCHPRLLRCAARYRYAPQTRSRFIGFRAVSSA